MAEGESAQVQSNGRGLLAKVMREVSFQHPIVYDTYNVCSLVEERKLHKLALGLLKDVCLFRSRDVRFKATSEKAIHQENH